MSARRESTEPVLVWSLLGAKYSLSHAHTVSFRVLILIVALVSFIREQPRSPATPPPPNSLGNMNYAKTLKTGGSKILQVHVCLLTMSFLGSNTR